MFFRKKAKQDETETKLDAEAPKDGEPVEGSMPEVTEVDLAAEAPALDADLSADLAGSVPVPAQPGEAVRLFPGFEREDFEVGFSTAAVPALVMRWKDGGDWFAVPPMFNRAVLSAMDERDSAGDLSRLLRSFGYDVESP